MKTFATFTALLLLAVGCQTVPGPSVSLVNVQFTDATVLESNGRFTLRFNNEQPEALRLRGGVHKIYLNGLYVGEGLSSEPIELPGLNSTTQAVEVHMSNLRLATRIKPIIEARVFDYRIESVLYPAAGGRLRSRSEGRLDLRDFQPTPPPGR